MSCERRMKIGSVSRRRSYEEEALEEVCVELRKIVARLEAMEETQGVDQMKKSRR
jgi:hypothetical protein